MIEPAENARPRVLAAFQPTASRTAQALREDADFARQLGASLDDRAEKTNGRERVGRPIADASASVKSSVRERSTTDDRTDERAEPDDPPREAAEGAAPGANAELNALSVWGPTVQAQQMLRSPAQVAAAGPAPAEGSPRTGENATERIGEHEIVARADADTPASSPRANRVGSPETIASFGRSDAATSLPNPTVAPSETANANESRSGAERPPDRSGVAAQSNPTDSAPPASSPDAVSNSVPQSSVPSSTPQSSGSGRGAGGVEATAPASGSRGAGGSDLRSMLGTSAVQSKLAGQGRPTAAPSPGSARGAMFARTDEALQAQASRGLAAALRQRGGVVQMRLTPESLGQLRVHLTMDQAQVSARFETSTAQARELLAGHASELRTALEARGLHVDSVQIVGPEPTAGTPGSMQDHPDQHSMAHDESSSAARERKNGASDRREPGPRDHDSRMDSLSAGGPTSAPALALDELGILRLDAIV